MIIHATKTKIAHIIYFLLMLIVNMGFRHKTSKHADLHQINFEMKTFPSS